MRSIRYWFIYLHALVYDEICETISEDVSNFQYWYGRRYGCSWPHVRTDYAICIGAHSILRWHLLCLRRLVQDSFRCCEFEHFVDSCQIKFRIGFGRFLLYVFGYALDCKVDDHFECRPCLFWTRGIILSIPLIFLDPSSSSGTMVMLFIVLMELY